MSFIVKGIDLPKGDEKLKIEIEPDGNVWVDQGSKWEKREGAAVQILRPHGRLGDLDRLKKSYYGTKDEIIFAFIMEYEIINAPTILEAEE